MSYHRRNNSTSVGSTGAPLKSTLKKTVSKTSVSAVKRTQTTDGGVNHSATVPEGTELIDHSLEILQATGYGPAEAAAKRRYSLDATDPNAAAALATAAAAAAAAGAGAGAGGIQRSHTVTEDEAKKHAARKMVSNTAAHQMQVRRQSLGAGQQSVRKEGLASRTVQLAFASTQTFSTLTHSPLLLCLSPQCTT